jgi:nucleotide-binding universal stress UspA family protein
MIQLDRVLVPVDFSDSTLQALKYGQELCEKFDAELHLVHVLEIHVTGTPQFAMGVAIPERVEESAAMVAEEMKKYPDSDWCEGHKVVRETLRGAPFVEIVRYAKNHNIDAIVMGTHGRTGLNHVFMGSVAENVVRHATCPVLIVRSQGHQFVSP